ncbi:hypothetical protein [Geminocystis sp. NIES-3709]|nr:hypothetical protein [Geminocystis sp. NIES-3709]BAQ64359.1 hypothetical protein GM3709_1124 [Geminocystis sp. NIES-3709]
MGSIVNEWLKVRGKEEGALICPVFRGGKVIVRRLSTDGVLKIITFIV